ncbi:MAG TPA: ribosome biogenesis GTP-binding protein YihA/YsxC [Myxococcota bacterium]|nr:ribosome biogenesis GTP-binding protein YihA/YsxC [Myxococcota bacterium]
MTPLQPVKTFAGGRIGFLGSFPEFHLLPRTSLPEIAFAGRSNVGKSSAINKLLNVKKVARVSNTPGRTQAINLFVVEDRVVFADLPGYGFAKVPLEVKARWKGLVEGYLGGREQLKLVVVLVDARHDVQRLDAELIWGLRQARIPIRVLATKSDKLKRSQRQRHWAALRRGFKLRGDELIGFSSADGMGLETAWSAFDAAAAGDLEPER